jgi:HK97 family phage major capsid protein
MKKHDFDGINRVMRHSRRSHRNGTFAAGSPLLRGMHLDGAGGGGGEDEGAIATLDATDLITVDPDLQTKLVKDPIALGKFVGRVQSYAQSTSKTVGEQREKLKRMAEDLKAAKEQTAEALTAAQRAEAIAKDAARAVPDGRSVGQEALARIPNIHEPDEEFRGKLSRGHYNAMVLSRQDLEAMDEPTRKFVERFRVLHDTLAIVDAFMLGLGGARTAAYAKAGGVQGLKLWKQYEPMAKRLAAAMDTAEAGAGAEWVPTGVGISLIEDIRPDFTLASYIPTIPMPRSPYVWPVQGGHFKSSKIGEGTADDLTIPTNGISRKNLATLNLTFTAVKQGGLLLTGSELLEDSIVALIAAIRADLTLCIVAGKEDAILNGQLTAAIDTAAPPAATDPGSFWDGLRYFATLTGAQVDLSAGVVVEKLTDLMGQMGKYGKSSQFGVWATSYIGWAKLLTLKDGNNALVLTADRVGSTSALQTGTLGFLLGSPLAVCDDYPQAMGAAGVNDGSAVDRTSLLRFDRRGFRDGEVRLSNIEASREWAFSTDQIAFRVTYRSQFKPVRTPSAAYKVVGAGVGLPIN